MEINQLPITSVTPYARNPRRNEAAIAKVAASIKEFGFRQPVVVDEDMVVVVGHTRLEAARQLGMRDIPVHVARGLTQAQIKAYRLADNRTGEDAQWDEDLLSLEFEDLEGEIDFSILGFDDSELIDITGKVPESLLPDLAEGDRDPFQQMTFILHDEQVDIVSEAIRKAISAGPFNSENENKNGNALTRICEMFNGKC